MQRDRETIYAYLQRLFYEYLNPPSEMASDVDGKLWKAAQELADDSRVTLVSSVVHGSTCKKVSHNPPQGWLHGENDDTPYDVDGVWYCGRCHEAFPSSPRQSEIPVVRIAE